MAIISFLWILARRSAIYSKDATRAGYTLELGDHLSTSLLKLSADTKSHSLEEMKIIIGKSGDIFSLGCVHVYYEILDALLVYFHTNFPLIPDNYANHISDKTFIDRVLAVKEHERQVLRYLGRGKHFHYTCEKDTH